LFSFISLIKQFDANKDGKVSKEELLAGVEKYFIGKTPAQLPGNQLILIFFILIFFILILILILILIFIFIFIFIIFIIFIFKIFIF
jgi:hypothetical protein